MKDVLLIDGDLLLHESSSVTERVFDYGDDVWIMSSNLKEAQELFDHRIASIHKELGMKEARLVISSTENFRKELSPIYKSARKATRKPLVFPALRDWAIEAYGAWIYPKLEADDTMGILATEPSDERRIMVSTDKDMLTVPGWLYYKGELRQISEDEANFNWLMQTLTGDPTDGYKGCPGIGPVGAKKLLDKSTKPDYGLVEMAYRKAGLTSEDALLNARFARILRYEDWDSETQTVRLWEPKR